MAGLADLLCTIVEAGNVADLRSILTRHVPTVLDCDGAVLTIVDSGEASAPCEEGTEAAIASCLLLGRPLLLPRHRRPLSVLAAPLIAGDKRLGVLTAFSERIDAFTEMDLQVLRSVAATAAAVVLACLDRSSDLAAARDESRQLHEELHAALDAIPHPVVIYDKDFNFRAWNDAFTEIQGYTDEMMRRFGGMAGLLRYEVEELDSFKGQTFEAVHQQYRDYYKFQDFNQSYQYWPMRGKHIDRRTRRTASGGWVSVLVDITDWVNAQDEIRRAKEEAEAAARKRSDLLAAMSHEFGASLAIVDAAAQGLQRRGAAMKPEVIAPRVLRIRSAARRMTRLTETTLRAARLDAGEIQCRPAPVDLRLLIADCVSELGDVHRSIRFEVNADGLCATVNCDEELMRLVLQNLLSNAAKFSSSGSTVRVSARCQGDVLVVNIRDQGVGIPRDEIPNVFQRFFRARTAAEIAGNGLGLNLSRELVRLHGGDVTLHSVVGVGTDVTVRIPGSVGGRQRLEEAG